ncbi:MAG TPA: DctP family TRAP transporter solute-binding subunit [Tepidisphaeraceae bacterium]|nr:DctP family TRAP transporter solute-binding subunit [Tepidisphaeraceae bacterium]
MDASCRKSGRGHALCWFAVAALLAIGGWASGSSAQAQSPKTLKLGYILSTHSQLGAGATVFADEVAKRTGGHYKIEQFPNSALGGEVEMLKAVQLGTVDMAFITGAPLPNFVPEIGVFNIPFLFRDVDHAHAVLDGPIGQSYLAKFHDKGLVALAWGENGMRHLTNSKREIRTPDDLKGLKLRLPQSDVMLAGFKALGANASPLAFPLLYGALQSGEFDGQENPIATIQSSKFNQVQKYLTLSGHVYDPAVLFISEDAFDDLSADDKKSFTEAARLGGQASRQFAADAEKNGVAELAQSGMKVVANVDRAAFAAAMASANPVFAKQFGGDLIQKIRDYR